MSARYIAKINNFREHFYIGTISCNVHICCVLRQLNVMQEHVTLSLGVKPGFSGF